MNDTKNPPDSPPRPPRLASVGGPLNGHTLCPLTRGGKHYEFRGHTYEQTGAEVDGHEVYRLVNHDA